MTTHAFKESRWSQSCVTCGRPRKDPIHVGKRIPPCPCECNRGEFCGGCGHAGCGRR